VIVDGQALTSNRVTTTIQRLLARLQDSWRPAGAARVLSYGNGYAKGGQHWFAAWT
jgi:hypothetical protein